MTILKQQGDQQGSKHVMKFRSFFARVLTRSMLHGLPEFLKPTGSKFHFAKGINSTRRSAYWLTPLMLLAGGAISLFAGQSSPLSVKSITPSGGNVIVTWTGGPSPNPVFQLLCKTNLSQDWQKLGATTASYSATVPKDKAACFFGVTTDIIAPSTPTGLTVNTNGNSDQLKLTWNSSSDNTGGSGLKKYNIYRNGLVVKQVNVPNTTITDTNLSPDTTYSYTVSALDIVGNQSAQTASVSKRTPKGQCTFSLSATSVSVAASANSGSVGVTSGTGCSWTAGSSASWITITSGASGSGSGAVYYSVAANTATTTRTGTLTVAGQNFTVTQGGAAPACSYSLSPSSASIATTASSGYVSVTAGAGCAWTSSSSASWITITSGASGNGSGYLYYSVAANTSTTSRTGYLTIAGQSFAITQAGAMATCSYTLSMGSASYGASATVGTVTVTTAAGCVWTASSSASWITITSGNSGNGNGTVNYSVTANTSTSSRTGTLTIAGQNYTVTQAGAAATCTYVLSSTSATAGSLADAGTVTVTAGVGCNWTATSSASWLTCLPASGSGTGVITWSALANTTTATRTGAITINGQTFTVTQAGLTVGGSGGQLQWLRAKTCSYQLRAVDVKTDRAGNVVIAGMFRGTADFGSGLVSSTGGSSMLDIFVAKYTPQGGLLWVKTFGSTGDDSANAVVVDSADNVILAGAFSSTVNFGGQSLTSSGYQNVFVAKFSSSGAHIWSKRFGGSGSEVAYAVAVDGTDNVFLAARLNSATADFGGITLVNAAAGFEDVVVAKLQPADGSTIWAKRWGGTGSESPLGMAVDRSGDVAITGRAGQWSNSTDLGGGTKSGAGIFVAKYSGADGSHRWSRLLGTDGNNFGKGVAVDPTTGNIIITGGFQGSVDFGTGLTSAGGGGGITMFLAGYDSAGTPLWVKTWGGDVPSTLGSDQGNALKVDGSGNLVLVGQLCSSANFGGGWLSGNGSANSVVASFTLSGNAAPTYRWAKRAAGGVSYGCGAAFTSGGQVVTTGFFQLTTDFGGTSATAPVGTDAAFIAQYGP
jgi:hypothetical protein